jgi:dipeptidyl aminopeptidase/acylaminoacyl peptidase
MKRITLLVLLIFLLAGCGTASPAELPLTGATIQVPSETATLTLVPSLTPTGTLIPTATPIPDPMTIQALRAGSYPGSDIVIEAELERGWNYRRYYAWYQSDGLRIYGLLTIPDTEMPEGGFPAIVFNHGYIPPDVYRTTERYIAYVDRIASAGYIVYRIDYRGHDRSEGEASGAYGSPGYTIDVLNAVASLKRHPQVNPEKIGMWGHSMGGYLTLRSMVVADDVKVGVIWAGVVASYTDLLYNWRRTGAFTPSPSSTGRGWRARWLEQYGTPEQNPEFWAAVSANTYLSDLSGPLQLHHGTLDEDVPLAFSIRLAEEVRAIGGIADLYTYEGDNHNISNYFTQAMDRTIAFYDQYLK